MIDKGMDNDKGVLQGLIDRANKRIAEIESGRSHHGWTKTPSTTPRFKWTSTSSTSR